MSTVNPELQQQPPDPEQEEVITDGGLFSDREAGADDSQWPIGDDEVQQTQPAAQPAAAPPAQPGAVQPAVQDPNAIIEHRLPTGHVLRGTQAQIIEQMNGLMARGTNVPQQYQQQRPQRQAQPDRRDPRSQWNSKTFQEEWYSKFTTDPFGAMEDFVKDYFGHDNPAEALDQSYSTSVQVSDRIAVADFLASTPDFPGTPQASAMLIERLGRDGAELTSHNLEVAFSQMVREGTLARVSAQAPAPTASQPPAPQWDYRHQYQQPQGQPPPVQQPPQSRGAAAPPSTPSGGQPPGGTQWRLTRDEFDNELTLQEQRAYITDHTIPQRLFQQKGNGRR